MAAWTEGIGWFPTVALVAIVVTGYMEDLSLCIRFFTSENELETSEGGENNCRRGEEGCPPGQRLGRKLSVSITHDKSGLSPGAEGKLDW